MVDAMDYATLMATLPNIYQLLYDPVSLTDYQVLEILKVFISKDNDMEGWMTFNVMYEIIRELGFLCSEKEVEGILRSLYNDFSEDINEDKVNFTIVIKVIDVLKQEKIILEKLDHSCNCITLIMLYILFCVIIYVFFSYKGADYEECY